MSGSTKAIVVDLNSKPAPQYYDPVADDYTYLQGEGGSAWATTIPPNGSIKPTAATVGVAAAQIDTGLARRRFVHVFNRGTDDVFIGADATVTTATGYPVPVGTGARFEWGPTIQVFAISGTAGQDVRVLETAG